ncbi:MAG: hypothetical protein GDA44_12745 [Prochloron sp. SP5CPC1]|nr:hypothetical protein [Candidatus Paraprochloron terpiosi SP5CPC1]
MDEKIKGIDKKIDEKINGVEEKIKGIDKKIDEKINGWEKRLETSEFVSKASVTAIFIGFVSGVVKLLFFNK